MRFARTLEVAADVVMALAFAFSVAVQANDPDPLRWMALYGLALVATVLSLLRRGHWALPAALAVVASAWAASLWPDVWGKVPFGDMFGAFEMADIGIEESREMYGLLIVAAWTAFLAWRTARRSRRTRSGKGSG